ncbi:hypothetical protein FORC82_p052 (plasmid) [Escherichia coli]|nr:hypothetical protein [Escherichia coli]QAZ74573.1 hypothetical protein FORC82_p052 [Escherichia coli]
MTAFSPVKLSQYPATIFFIINVVEEVQGSPQKTENKAR